jgi:hypothetical protein
MMKQWKVWVVVLACLPMAGLLRAQDDKKKEMPTYLPTKEHQLLKKFDGEWDYKPRCMIPGQPAHEGQGTESARYTEGGFWLVLEDRGTAMGKDFSGGAHRF